VKLVTVGSTPSYLNLQRIVLITEEKMFLRRIGKVNVMFYLLKKKMPKEINVNAKAAKWQPHTNIKLKDCR